MERMVQLPIRIEKDLINRIDKIVEKNPEYRNRSDYIRKKVYSSVNEDMLKLMDETALEIRDLIIKRGAKPGLMTAAEKRQIADEFLKEKKLH